MSRRYRFFTERRMKLVDFFMFFTVTLGIWMFLFEYVDMSLYKDREAKLTQELAEARAEVRRLKAAVAKRNGTPRLAPSVNNESSDSVETPAEQDANIAIDTDPTLPSSSGLLDARDAFLPADVATEETPAEEVPVSPFGFGPYPEVPADYPNDMIPSWVKTGVNPSRDYELMHRVLIRLWNQGDKRVSGAFMDGGFVYPIYPNTAYVEHREIYMPDGTVHRIIKSANGPLGTTPIVKNGFSVLPDGVKSINKKDAGIDPYDFLDLK